MSDDTRGAEPTGDAQNPWLPQDPPADQPYVAPQGETFLPGQGQPYIPAPDQPQVAAPTDPPADQPYPAGADQPYLPGPDQPYAAGPAQPHLPGPDQQQYLGGDFFGSAPTKRRSWLMPVLGGIAAVAVLLGSVVGVKLYRTLSGGGPQPEQWAPASTFAFAKVDLDPPAGAKVAAYQFSQKFPSMPRAKSANGLQDELLSSMFTDAPLDYIKDIKPWAGDRLAIAAFNGSDGTPQVVFIVAVKDGAKAQSALSRLTAEDPMALDIDVESNFILISPTPGGAQDAAQAARASSLADAKTYKSDVGLLHSDRIVTAWFDVDETAKNVGKLDTLGGLDAVGRLSGSQLLEDTSGSGLDLDLNTGGRAVVAVRVASDYLELEARAIGSKYVFAPSEVGDMMGELGSNTVAALALSHPDDLITEALGKVSDDPTIGPDLLDGLDAFGGSVGLQLPDDLVNLLGSAWVLSLDAMPTDDSAPSITSRSRPADPARAQDTAQSLLDALGAQGSDTPLDVRTKGKDLLVTFGQAPASLGKLVNTTSYQKAMGSLPANVQMAAYVNLTPIWDLKPFVDEAADIYVLKSIGVVIGADSNSQVARIRLVVGG